MQNAFLLKRCLTLIILSYALFFLGNSCLPLTDPDEVFYVLTAKEMAEHNEWSTPYIFNQPQFEKPILTYWLLRFIFDVGGITPFNARFFPALFAMLGVLGVYALGLLGFKNERKSFWAALVLCSSAIYVGMAKTVFTDMVFTVFILYALLFFYWAYAEPRRKSLGLLGFYVFAALASLTKGPLGVLLPELAVILFLLYRKQIHFLKDGVVVAGFLLCLAITLPWYILMIQTHGQTFIHEFFYNDHWRRFLMAEHKGNDRWFFYPMTMLMGVFPWTLFLGAAFINMFKKLKWGADGFDYFILSWILVVFIVFQSAHSKLTSYILPLFPALALLCGGYIEECLNNAAKSRVMKTYAAIMAGIFIVLGAAVVAAYPYYQKYLPTIFPAYFLSGLLLFLGGGIIVLLLKEKISASLVLLSLCFLPFLGLLAIANSDIEPQVSSFQACQYVPHIKSKKTVLLTSKRNARGVRFYTGQDVAVLDINGSNYFSPHPIPILNSQEKLTSFLQDQELTYAVVWKGAYEVLKNLPPDKFHVRLLKMTGKSFVMSIEDCREGQ